MTGATALLFRYADFITQLGGTEVHLGWIVGIGTIGCLIVRLVLGTWIDRFGSRLLWLTATLLFVAVCFAHVAITSCTDISVYLLRIAYCSTIAGIYGASITFTTSRVSTRRVAEVMGMLGSAGFLGTMLGPLLGDALFGLVTDGRDQVTLMFVATGLLALISLPFAWAASRKSPSPVHVAGPSIWQVTRSHCSGMALMIGVAMGMGVALPGIFLRTFTADLNIPRIGIYFLTFSIAGFAARVLTRHWFERFGNRRMILLGMTGLMASQLLFLLVHAEWQLIVPAIGFGVAQAVVFPAVFAAGSVGFPREHRGLAVVLTLAACDLGQLIGAPMAGEVLHCSEIAGLPPYPTMFITMVGLLAVAVIWYAIYPDKDAESSAVLLQSDSMPPSEQYRKAI